MTWQPATTMPDKPGKIAVLIGDKLIKGSVSLTMYTVFSANDDYCDFYLGEHGWHVNRLPFWIKSSHLKDPDWWCYLPELSPTSQGQK